MNLKDILFHKGATVYSIEESATLFDVVQKMVDCNCGSLVVCDGQEQMVGIITERDILRCLASNGREFGQICVADRMTKDVVVGKPCSSVHDTMGLLTEKRIRHLPVLDEDGSVVGMVSIGDLVKAKHQQVVAENHHMKKYIQSEVA